MLDFIRLAAKKLHRLLKRQNDFNFLEIFY